jgi:hypothetical protein
MREVNMQDKPKWVSTAADFLIDNWAALATILYATYIIYWQDFANGKISTDRLITAVITVLGLLATSEIIERYRRLSKIEKSTTHIASLVQEQIVERPPAGRFFEAIPILDPFVKNAHTIDLMGLSLTSTLNKQLSNLREADKNGAAVRIIVANPARKSMAIRMSALRSEEKHNEGYFRKRLAASFEDIEYLQRCHQALPANKGNFNVHLLDYAPSFGIMGFDVNQPNGMVFVEVYPHGTGYDTQVAFSLSRSRDGEWFRYFLSQFEDVWQKTEKWEPCATP